MKSEIIFILVASVFLMAALCISLIARLIHKNRLREISSTLDDISEGHINHKILARPDEIPLQFVNIKSTVLEPLSGQADRTGKGDGNRRLMTSLSMMLELR